MEVRGGGLRGKSIQSEVVKLLGENGEGYRCRLGFINLEIQLAEGIKALKLHVALKRRKAFDGCANEAVFKRLSERQSIFNDRPGKGGPGSESFDSNNMTIPVSGPWNQVLNGEMKLVEVAGTGFHA